MGPVGKHRLLRYEIATGVAAEPRMPQGAHVSNLLMPTEFIEEIQPFAIKTLRAVILRNWDGFADSGGAGGSRVSFVPDPLIAA